MATRSLISWTRGTRASAATWAPSTTQARLGVLARLSITGPAMPKQAALSASRRTRARKASTIARSPEYSAL